MAEEKAWRKEATKFPRAFPDFEVDPKTAALLIVDFQNLYANPEHGLLPFLSKNYPEPSNYCISRITKVARPNCQKLLKFFREHKLRVFYSEFGSAVLDYSDMLPLRKLAVVELERKMGTLALFARDSYEYQTIDDLKPEPGELIVNKRTRNAFVGTGLDHSMRMMGIESVAIAGTATNACVLATAIGASDLGYKTILLDDASATFSDAEHDAALRIFYTYFGQVMDTHELIAALSKKLQADV